MAMSLPKHGTDSRFLWQWGRRRNGETKHKLASYCFLREWERGGEVPMGCQDACPLEIDGELKGALSWGRPVLGGGIPRLVWLADFQRKCPGSVWQPHQTGDSMGFHLRSLLLLLLLLWRVGSSSGLYDSYSTFLLSKKFFTFFYIVPYIIILTLWTVHSTGDGVQGFMHAK